MARPKKVVEDTNKEKVDKAIPSLPNSKDNVRNEVKEIDLKERIINILDIDYKGANRRGGGLFKLYDLGNINPEIVISRGGKNIKSFVIKSNEQVKKIKRLLQEKLGEDYRSLTIETKLFKPKYGNTGDSNFKVGFYIYGKGFERIVLRVGKKKNIKYIDR